jgi:PAS domain S-box-containing protein
MAIINLAEDAIVSVDENQRIILANPSAERIFGYTAGELLGQPLDVLIPADAVTSHRNHVDRFASSATTHRRMGERLVILGRRKSGEVFPAEAAISRVETNGQLILTAIVQDISQRKAAEDALLASLRDKEILLKETHHRVKNNLQVVSSLLGLQSRFIQDAAVRTMFQESQNRVHSMALLHEELYRSDNLHDIDCEQYFRALAAHIFRSYGVSSSRIKLRLDFGEIRMDLDQAVPCGLVVNELLSNALKHAFPDGRAGEVCLAIKPAGGGQIALTVRDDGVGLPPDTSIRETRSLGLRLVRRLAEQIGASLRIRTGAGTEIELKIPSPGGETGGAVL